MAHGLLERVRRLFRQEPEVPEEVASPRRETRAAVEHVQPRVLMIVHHPPVASDGGRRLTGISGWNDPESLSLEYSADPCAVSGVYPRYRIVERIDGDWFAPKVDGFRAHHQWWLGHTPHAERETDWAANNRSRYTVDPSLVP